MANAICVKNNALSVCGNALVVGECESALGACCFGTGGEGPPDPNAPVQSRVGQCLQMTAAQCSQAGGMFLGGPCEPNPCGVVPAPGCCGVLNPCYLDGSTSTGDSYTIRASITFSAMMGGVSASTSESYEDTLVLHPSGQSTCNYPPPGYSYRSGVTIPSGPCAAANTSATVSFVSERGSISQDPEKEPPFLLIGAEYLNDSFAIVEAGCSGGNFSVDLPDGPAGPCQWTSVHASGSLTISRAHRCDGQPERGRCCLPTVTGGIQDCVSNTLQSECLAAGGDWAVGDCATNPCPTGACCQFGGICNEATEIECNINTQGLGVWFPNRHCNEPLNPCTILGACCLNNGQCIEPVTQSQCFSQGGLSFSPGGIQGLPYVPQCPALDCSVPLPCCQDTEPVCLNRCYIRGSLSPTISMTLSVQAEFWQGFAPNPCALVATLSDNQENINVLQIDQCDYQSTPLGATLIPPGGAQQTVQAQFIACHPTAGPHVVVVGFGRIRRYPVACFGTTGTFQCPAADFPNFGAASGNCAAGQTWRNIIIQFSASIPEAHACISSLARIALPPGKAPKTRILMPGVDFGSGATGCSGCGQGIGKRVVR